jgi:hypothetical protein
MKLGLDASTTTCGWAFFDEISFEVKDCGFLDISKQTTNKEKSTFVIDFLNKNSLIKSITAINLEAALSGFAGGFTSQQVIIKLARFNAVFEYIISEQYKIPVNLINVTTIRKKAFGKCREKGMKPKVFVKERLELLVPDLNKWDVYKKSGKWDDRNSDTYDAIVTAMY